MRINNFLKGFVNVWRLVTVLSIVPFILVACHTYIAKQLCDRFPKDGAVIPFFNTIHIHYTETQLNTIYS